MRAIASLFIIILWVMPFVLWLTHVIACIKAGAYLLLIAGAIMFPIGIIHGIMIWLGVGAV